MLRPVLGPDAELDVRVLGAGLACTFRDNGKSTAVGTHDEKSPDLFNYRMRLN